MQKLKILFAIILTISVSSCVIPKIKDQIQCTPILDSETPYCLCRMYRFTEDFVGGVGSPWNEEIMFCNRLIGHPPDNYANVSAFYEAIRFTYQESNCR